jgi:dTDP-4-dehydrorhamnose reductase
MASSMVYDEPCLTTKESGPKHILLLGATGWIGSQLQAIFEAEPGRFRVFATKQRLDNFDMATLELDIICDDIDCVVNCAGLTGRPNVDWCETHTHEVIRTNLIGTLAMMEVCEKQRVHLINMATGCIFGYDDAHPIGGPVFSEDDEANFDGSFYSLTKGMVDKLAPYYENTLHLRLRMPISCDGNPRCFVTKIRSYAKVVNIPNSMSVLPNLLPLVPLMVERRLVGRLNFVNPGPISHNEILDMYKEIIDPKFSYTNFDLEEHDTVVVAKRSNNTLDTGRIEKEFGALVKPVHQALREAFEAQL